MFSSRSTVFIIADSDAAVKPQTSASEAHLSRTCVGVINFDL